MARRRVRVPSRSAAAAFTTFTTPAGVTAEQQVRALLAWAERHPDCLSESRRASAVSAFAEAWPCG